jgi:hypothetical protein
MASLILKFFHDTKDLQVTLKTEDGNDYEYVIIGDAEQVSGRELMQMTSGNAPKGWTKQ